MKLNHFIIKSMACAAAFSAVSCTAGYEEINRNPYQPRLEDMTADDYLSGAMLLNLQDLMVPEQENFAQFVECLMPGGFSGYIADSNLGSGWSGRFATYDPADGWLAVPFEFFEKFYPNYLQFKNQVNDEIYLALGELYRVTVMARVTDTYGPIPYSQMGAQNALSAAYDSQKDVYTRMLGSLDDIIGVLTANSAAVIPAGSDRVYGGIIGKWARFANTLKLRLAMRIVYADPELARSKAEEAVNSEAGIIENAADGAFRSVSDHNPWERFMPNWGDARMAADLVCYMNGYNDPRREAYYGRTTFASEAGKLPSFNFSGTESYCGLPRGIRQTTYHEASHGYSCMNITVSDDIRILPASEAAFLCAEGALRGWNMKGTDAQTWYEKGIALSFEERGAGGAAAYIADATSTPADFNDPLHYYRSLSTGSTATIAWNSNGSDFETNLERIITQKWIAIFPNCMEAWSEYRRTGYPRLIPAYDNLSVAGTVSDSEGARRMPYPADEYRENAVHISDAVAKLASESGKVVGYNGGDNMGTHVWWDCNPRIK